MNKNTVALPKGIENLVNQPSDEIQNKIVAI